MAPYAGADASAPWLLEPPYLELRPLGPHAPVLGSILVAPLAGNAAAIRLLVRGYERFPWCPVALVARRRGVEADELEAAARLPATTAFFTMREESPHPMPRLVRDAVRGRRPPDADDVAGYVAARLARPGVVTPLAAAMDTTARQATSLGRGWHAVAERLAELGPLDAADWRLVHLLAASAGHDGGVGRRLGLDEWEEEAALARLAGITPRSYRELAGWEWFVEAVLRHAGYVATRQPFERLPRRAAGGETP